MIPTLYAPFQKWSENGSVIIFSDPHFNDEVCKKMDPNWPEPEEIVKRINDACMPNDTFVCLGDVGDVSYLKMIRAKYKVLLTGNHDKIADYREYFDENYTGPLFIADKILLSHEPVVGLTWCVNIHGHDHGNKYVFPPECKHVNLAANVCDFTPMNLGKEIKNGLLSGIKSLHRQAIDGRI